MRFPSLLVLCGILGSLAPFGCSAIVAADPVQCTDDSECTARGPDFQGTGCALAGPNKGFCVENRAATLGECATNADCVDLTGPGSVCTVDAAQPRCVPLLGDDCPLTFGNPFVENTVTFAILGDFTANDPGRGRDLGSFEAASLALSKFQQKGSFALAGNRRIALVGCSQARPKATTARLAAAGVKAILGPSDPSKLVRVVEQAGPLGIPVFATSAAQNTAVAAPGGTSSVFLTGSSQDSVVAGINGVLSDLSGTVRTARNRSFVRVAVLFDGSLEAYAPVLRERLVFNGKTALQNQADASCNNCYTALPIARDGSPIPPSEIAAALAEFKADIVIPVSGGGFGSYLARLEALPAPAVPPYYLAPFIDFEDASYRVELASHSTLVNRVIGFRPRRQEAPYASFESRYRTFVAGGAGQGSAPTLQNTRVYETTKLAIYSAFMAGRGGANGRFEGAQVTAAVPLVTTAGADVIDVGPLGIPNAIGALARSGKMSLNGLFTSFGFLPNRSVANAWEVWCMDASGRYLATKRTMTEAGEWTGVPAVCGGAQ
jgi:hypothetical protein